MTVIFYASSENPSSTSSTTWVNHVSKSGSLNAQKHWVWVYAEYGGIATNRNVAIRVTVNGSEVAFDYHQPTDAGEYESFMTMVEIEPPANNTPYTVILQYVSQHASQTALIRRARIMLMQE